MKIHRPIKVIILFLLFNICYDFAQAQDAPTPKDAVDFIKKIGTENKRVVVTSSGKLITRLLNISVIDGKLYILDQTDGWATELYIINLSRVRMKENQIYADNKDDITLNLLWELPSKFYKLSSAKDQYDFFIKKSGTGPSPQGIYWIDSDFAPSNEATGRYKDENYYERIVKAFDFLIKYYGGGKVLNDSNSKF